MNRNNQKSEKGLSVIGSIALIPLIFIGVIVLLFFACELNKAYWDYRVAQMCEEDGGVEIYEHIDVTPEEFANLPQLAMGIGVRERQFTKSSDLLFAEVIESTIHNKFLKVERQDVSIKRLINEQEVARYSSFSRVGGDFPTGIGHTSSYRCLPSSDLALEIKEIFIVKEE